jgi:hypothetical protein
MNTKFTNKDMGSALGLPVGIVLVWIIGMLINPKLVPSEVATAIGSICSFAVAYFIRER